MGSLDVSIFSILTSILLFNLAVLIIILNREKNSFIINHGINLLLFSTLLAIIRLMSPIDLYHAKIINIYPISKLIEPILLFKIGNHFFIWQLLLLLWGIGTILFLIYFIYTSLLDIYKLDQLNHAHAPTLEALYSSYLDSKIIVKVSSEVDIPKVWGFRKCHIYFPSYNLSSEEWKLILDHEIQHIKLHDTFIRVLFLFFTALFWWNPLMHLLQRNLNQMLELRCDAKLIQKYSSEMQYKYLATLLKVLKIQNSPAIASPKNNTTASFINYSNYSLTRQRFEIILGNKASNAKKKYFGYALCIFLFISSYFIILQPDEYTATEPGPSLILHTADDEYELYIDGILFKRLTSKDIHSGKYSKYEIIEGSN